MAYAKAYLTTEDDDFSQELNDAKIEGVTVLTRLTAAVQWDQVIQHTVQFSSDRAVDVFYAWLLLKMASKVPKKTKINGRKVSSEKTKLAEIIKSIKHEIDAEDDDEDAE